MGLLDHLWDDTMAGPPPVGKLRKFSSVAGGAGGSLQVTRSITVVRSAAPSPSSSAASSPRSPSLSPAGDQPSPFTPRTPRDDLKRLRRKEPAQATGEMDAAEPRYPTVYDWVVIGSLDR